VVRANEQSSTPLGNGTLCLGGTLYRLDVLQSNFIGSVRYEVDTSVFPMGGMITSGSTWNWQLWYRDSVGTGFNFSDAVETTWCE